jgi:hypothetical protein
MVAAAVGILVTVAGGALAVLYPAEAAAVGVAGVAWWANVALLGPRLRRADKRRRAEREQSRQVARDAQVASMRAKGFPQSVIDSWLADPVEGGLGRRRRWVR